MTVDSICKWLCLSVVQNWESPGTKTGWVSALRKVIPGLQPLYYALLPYDAWVISLLLKHINFWNYFAT